MSDQKVTKIKESLKKKLRNKYLIILLVILGFSAAIRFKYAFFDGMWVDEAEMARMAVDIQGHPLDYSTEWRGEETKRLPVYIYSMIVSNVLFGGILGTETALRLVNPILGVASVLATYIAGREMFNKNIGIIAASIFALNPQAWFLSERMLIGTSLTLLFTMTITAFYYGLEDRKYSKYALWSVGPLVALAILTKQPAYSLGAILPFYFFYRKKEEIKDYFMTDKDLKDSELYSLLTERNYYVAGGLGVLTLIPWMVRNMSVCNFPMCGMLKALSFASRDVTRATASVQSSFYFIFALGTILTIPVTIFLVLRLLQYLYRDFSKNKDLLVKKIVLFFSVNAAVFVLDTRLLPLMFLTSLSIFASSDADKILWLWTGIGIGIMSVPEIKVPRYIVFTIPALVLISSKSIYSFSGTLSNNIPGFLDRLDLDRVKLSILIVVPILIVSLSQGLGMMPGSGYSGLEPAGNWLSENIEEEDRFISSSSQLRFYARPYNSVTTGGKLPQNNTAFQEHLLSENISYAIIDVYERTQPQWVQTKVPPYRLPRQLISEIRQGIKSPQEVFDGFSSPPEYLIPVQQFGETNVPLTRNNKQPEVIIYRVNRTALQ